ncbi:HAMP domain protein [Mycoavidus cysteinexigens]|uniref:histidine kinase n=2 Tax=Mycoavidus cysteinexigens TaxID=1553431 RepID=A0A2Z6ETQ5_9BURK|nr:HAMP domain protein [Mycoavidus cysteinexigens]GAM52518.1 sensory box histidine kinase/response regulator [bacterium endosymbiont of Mortierella elongata FMR23-6]GLR01590.1 histidine kinase [Mycoavidus cysteinexigens]
MVLFWLLVAGVNFYYLYTKARYHLNQKMTARLEFMTQQVNQRFGYAERQVRGLAWAWHAVYPSTNLPSYPRDLRRAVFVPFEQVTIDRVLARQASIVMEHYGRVDEIYDDLQVADSVEMFLLVPDQGVVFFQPQAQTLSAEDSHHRVKVLASLQNMPFTKPVHWSPLFQDACGSLYVAALARDPDTGVIAGQILRMGALGAFLTAKTEEFGSLKFALQDEGRTLLWSNIEPHDVGALSDVFLAATSMLGSLDSACTHPIRIHNFFVAYTPLSGPSLQLLVAYPAKYLINKTFALVASTVPWALLVQLLLSIIVFVILQLYLGRPLRKIVTVLDTQQATDPLRRLPEGRTDELGRIAKAYNVLIQKLSAYYRTLEDKVLARTHELEEARQLAEQVSHRKSEHIASISHEIRTPLNGIVGAISLLERSSLSPQQQDLTAIARKSSGYLLNIVNDLLDFSRIEAGQLKLSFALAPIFPMLDQVMLTVNLKAQEKRLVLRTWVASDVPQQMMLDDIRVRQILINLLGNAVKFTQQGHIHLHVWRQADQLLMAVEDTGAGIPDEHRQTIFQPFIQVRPYDNGNGLGLAIASQIVGLMGGEILLDSQAGMGSRFTLRLPLREPSPPLEPFNARLVAAEPLHRQLRAWGIEPQIGANPLLDGPELVYLPDKLRRKVTAALRGETLDNERVVTTVCPWSLKVLVVDDMPINRGIVGKMLQELGQHIETAASGHEALQLGRQQVFDLVFLDMRMPEMDGLETTEHWRNPHGGILDQNTPIIALTANALPGESERVKAAGMNGYLAKPVSLEQLAAALNYAASQQLVHGIELRPNQQLQKPLLNLADDALRDQLYATLTALQQQLDAAWRAHQRDLLLDVLHTLKGCAGQSGIDLVFKATEQQETQIHQGNWPSDQAIKDLGRLISQAIASLPRAVQ